MEEKTKKIRLKRMVLISFILIFVGVFVFAQPEPEKYFKLKMLYNPEPLTGGGKLELREPGTRLGDYSVEPPTEEDYEIEYYDFNGDLIESRPYLVGITNDLVYNVDLLFYIPYHSNAKTIAIKSLDENVESYHYIGYLANICGDGFCQEHESYADCPDDRPLGDCEPSGKDDYCNEVNDEICDPDCMALAGRDADEAFMFDTTDCHEGLLPEDYTCGDGTLYCVQDTRVACFYDRVMSEHWFVYDSCVRGACVDGKCEGEFDVIRNVGCEKDEHCMVDGLEQWECDCFGNCHPPRTFEGQELCCDVRLNED